MRDGAVQQLSHQAGREHVDALTRVRVEMGCAPDGTLHLTAPQRFGTPFQRRVWEALLAIPCGARVTYAALAHRIGMPNAARAVASACAANAIALGIPCHRVVRSDGTLSGYRWGVERKRALIDGEALA